MANYLIHKLTKITHKMPIYAFCIKAQDYWYAGIYQTSQTKTIYVFISKVIYDYWVATTSI